MAVVISRIDNRRELYDQGLSDGEIAKRCGIHRTGVVHWRKKAGLPNNGKVRQVKAEAALLELRRLYDLGMSDSAIARQTDSDQGSVTRWRAKAGLPPHTVCLSRGYLTSEARARRMVLYQLRWSDHAIAAYEGVALSVIWGWRKRIGLAPNFATGVTQKRNPRPGIDSLLARIRQAIGRGLPRDIADDAVMDLLEAVLSGAIPIAQIEASARKFGNRTLDAYASKWGTRSLDEDLSDDGGGFRMIDLIADERSSSWLEEMGATVW